MAKLVMNMQELESIRIPTEQDPWRILLSGCIAGLPCGVDGTDYGMPGAQPAWFADPRVRTLAFCPEDHGLGTPRRMPDLHGGDGFQVLDEKARILDEERNDLTAGMLEGATAMVELAQRERIDFAVLTDRSAACGSQVISIGCRLDEPVQHVQGVGVATAMLLRHGFHVVSQRDPRTLGFLGAKLDSQYAPGPEVVDHHQSPWVLEHFGSDE